MATMNPMVLSWFRPRGGGSIGRDEALAKRLLTRWDEERDARDRATRLIAWYQRDRAKIVDYLKKQASVTFGEETNEWQIPIINGVYRTIRRLAMTYQRPPERKYFIGTKELSPDSPELVKIENMYGRLDMDKRLRQLDRWATLLNTVHFEPVYRRGHIAWDVRLRPDVLVVEELDDYLEYAEFCRRILLTSGKDAVQGFIYWAADRYLFIRDDGFFWPGPGSSDGSNPYAGETFAEAALPVPVITVRKTEASDYWGRYGSDIVDSFEQANIQLGNTWENMFFQGHGQPIAINTGMGKQKGQKVKVGVRHPITVEGLTKEDMIPDIRFATPEPKITEGRQLIDWFIKLNSGSYGMPPSAWAQEEKALSGFAKMIDSEELLEDRDEQVNDYVRVEKQAFEASRAVFNRNHPVEGEHVNPEITLEVSFDEIEFPETPQDAAAAAAIEIQNNLSSAVDWIMKKRKISSREEATKLLEQIVKENAQVKKTMAEAFGISEQAPPQDRNAQGGNQGD